MEEQPKNQKKQKSSNQGGIGDYARYSGMAFEMIAIIGLSTYGGIKIDERAGTSPLFTVILSLTGVAAAIYIVIRDLIKRSKGQ